MLNRVVPSLLCAVLLPVSTWLITDHSPANYKRWNPTHYTYCNKDHLI